MTMKAVHLQIRILEVILKGAVCNKVKMDFSLMYLSSLSLKIHYPCTSKSEPGV